MGSGTLVLGIGNVLWADEGFGVRVVEALHAGWSFPGEVSFMDGGTQGLYLLPHVQEARRMLVFDAIDYRLAPGMLQVVRVPAPSGSKVKTVGFLAAHGLMNSKSISMRCGTSARRIVMRPSPT